MRHLSHPVSGCHTVTGFWPWAAVQQELVPYSVQQLASRTGWETTDASSSLVRQNERVLD